MRPAQSRASLLPSMTSADTLEDCDFEASHLHSWDLLYGVFDAQFMIPIVAALVWFSA